MNNPEVIVFATRGAVIIISACCGMMSIYLGWRLILEKVRSKSNLEIESKGFAFKVSTNLPGIFFISLGVLLLAFVIHTTKIEYEFEESQVQKANIFSQPLQTPTFSSGEHFLLASATPENPSATKPDQNCKRCNCLYSIKKKISFFDDGSRLQEKQEILDALDAAISSLGETLKEDDTSESAIKNYLKLVEIRQGFEVSNENQTH